ncbi:NAD-dependent succinate-semialdehyde dehydrogenase [bacterium]|nr:NAD-dependent succinate-semialdehyde dehydrogenase [bacterium]
MAIQSVNPATGELVKTYDEYSAELIENKLRQAEKTYQEWRLTSFDHKTALMKNVAKYLLDNKRFLGEIITLEMGRPIIQSIAEIEKCAWVCNWYAENAEKLLAGRKIMTDAERSYVRYDPIGPVLAIMPWNYPFWQVMRFAAPALMAGNVGVLKHASNVPKSSLEIEKIFLEAGFPEGCFSSLLISARATDAIIRDRRIAAVTLTGSEAAGSAVASTAGKFLKKSLLELGGSDPFIVLSDADLDKAAKTAAQSRNMNAGQSCIAAKRFIVVEEIADSFIKKFISALKELKVGDPMNTATDLGPMARGDLRNELHDQVTRSINTGAKCEFGGFIPEGPGYYYPVTMMTGITENTVVFQEETFGPVAAVIRVPDEDEAVRVANSSEYGLSSSLWTKDMARAEMLVPRINAGAVFINGMTKSDPRIPFGGIKRSGYGRELSEEGIREFCNTKSVWIGKQSN